MDDFGVNYVGKEHADHLIKYTKENYDIAEDWEGKSYLGLTFDWNYYTRSIHLSVPIIFLTPSNVSNARSPRYCKALPTTHTYTKDRKSVV